MQKLRRGFCTCVWNYIERTFDQQWMQSWSQATLISSSSRWARTKKTKKIRSPQTPYWEAPAKHTIPHFILIGGVWSVICWFGIGVVSKCLSSFGRYIPSPTYCGARDETSCLMCTVWAAGDAGFSTAPSAQKPKKIKKSRGCRQKVQALPIIIFIIYVGATTKTTQTDGLPQYRSWSYSIHQLPYIRAYICTY